MELSINNLIKLILGILVVIAVVAGFSLFFKNKVIELFSNISPEVPQIVLSALK